MKEPYFSQDSLDALSAAWMQAYAKPRKAASQPFRLDRAGLLILDMQHYFLDEESHAWVPGAIELIPRLNQLAAYFRSSKRPVIATQHLNTEEDAGMMASWWGELITPDHELAEIHPRLAVEPGEVIRKTQYDAFYGSELGALLDQWEVTQLVIGGVMTHLCCETTARAAFVSGYEVFFLVDGTATYQLDFHTATLRNLAHGVAVLTTTRKLLEGPG